MRISRRRNGTCTSVRPLSKAPFSCWISATACPAVAIAWQHPRPHSSSLNGVGVRPELAKRYTKGSPTFPPPGSSSRVMFPQMMALTVPMTSKEVQCDATERLGVLFDAHHGRLYRLARRLSPTVDDAKDLVQETFLRAARAPAS